MSGCFVYLVNHTPQAVADGRRSLALLEQHYLRRFPAPIVLFHEAALTREMRNRLLAECRADVICVPITFERYPYTDRTDVGYRHMCRFFTCDVFQAPVLKDFDYSCRLDTDSFITAPVDYDIFAYARDTDAWYGYLNDAIRDRWEYCQGLWATAQAFINAQRAKTYATLYTDVTECGLYYTNFEVCYLPWFRREPWTAYADAIDKAGGIYQHRWGDHTIRYIGVRSFMSPERIRRYVLPYEHQGIGAA